tara:strand:- start:1254 stop:1778 length:525 start_codon:yes stop_codon:yes gene_type:complete
MKLKKFNYKNVNSTNDVAIRKIKKGFNSGIVVSERQKRGRGRYGKKWISFKGNLLLSIFFEIKKNLSIQELTKNNCLSLKKIMSKYLKQKITIKLPNDLLVEGKKLSGILQERIYYNDKKFIIIGIGINIIRNPFIKNYPTTNLFELTGKKISKSNIFSKIKKNYEKKIKYLCT